METQGYTSHSANSVMKKYLSKFRMVNDIRINDIDWICEEIRNWQGSKELLSGEWLTGEFKEQSAQFIAETAIAEALTGTEVSSNNMQHAEREY